MIVDRAIESGCELVLRKLGKDYEIRANGMQLMSSLGHGSEVRLAELGCAPVAGKPDPRVLIGGLGMGYTLRAALGRLAPGARIVVAELFEKVVAWNRGSLAALNGNALDDPRVTVRVGDIATTIDEGPFDAILLDVDNGPRTLSVASNAGLYDERGLAAFRRALHPGGTLAVWSADPDDTFAARLAAAGFTVSCHDAQAVAGDRAPTHTIFVARIA